MRGRLRCSGRGTGLLRSLCRTAVRHRGRRGFAGRLRQSWRILEPASTDAELERPELSLCGGNDLGCAGDITTGVALGFDHNPKLSPPNRLRVFLTDTSRRNLARYLPELFPVALDFTNSWT